MEDGNAAESWRLFCKTLPFSRGLLALFFGNCVSHFVRGLTSREPGGRRTRVSNLRGPWG